MHNASDLNFRRGYEVRRAWTGMYLQINVDSAAQQPVVALVRGEKAQPLDSDVWLGLGVACVDRLP